MDDNDLARVDVIKLDIEGAELRVLDGARKTLERFRPVLVVECNPVALERFQNASASVLVETLRAVYGRVFFIAGTSLHEITSDEQIERELRRHGIVDLVCGARAELMVARTPRPSAQELKRALAPQLRRAAARLLNRRNHAPLALNFVHSPSLHGPLRREPARADEHDHDRAAGRACTTQVSTGSPAPSRIIRC